MTLKNIVFKGLPVHYEMQGEGPPLIFLHGFNESIHIWDSVIPDISNQYQCILIDLPGFGQSPLPANLNIRYMADAVYRVIEELRIHKPIVLGHSMGGYVTLELALKHPGLLSGAGLIHSTAFADSDEKKQNRLKTIEFLERNPVESFFKVFIPGLFAPNNLGSRFIETVENIIYQTRKDSVILATRAMMERDDRTGVLKKSPIPWLFIAGKYDQLMPLEQISLQVSFCQKSMFEILSHSGHMGIVEEPARTSGIILKFAEWVALAMSNKQ